MSTFIPALLATTLLALPLSQQEAESHISDRGEFFSAEAEAAAAKTIAELARTRNVEVRVETFAQPPDDKAANVQRMTAAERSDFFADWLKEIAREKQAKGILILICREPAHLRVGIGQELYRRGFRDAERSAISERLLSAFRARQYDQGLNDALTYIDQTAERKPASAAAAPARGQAQREPAQRDRGAARPAQGIGVGFGGLLCLGLGALMLLFGVFAIINRFRRTPQRPQGYGYGPGQQVPGGGYGQPSYNDPTDYSYQGRGDGRGGMFGGLMSGLGGALLGNWLYDRFTGPSAHAGEPPMHRDPSAHSPMYDDSSYYDDFSSSGGDFGGDDFGGDDFGGGDFGGDDGGDF